MSLKLSDLRAAADVKYAHTTIDIDDERTVTLLNPLRMSPAARKVLTGMGERMQGGDADQFEVVGDALIAAARTKAEGALLVKELGGDLAVALEIFQSYMEGTQAGEA